MSAKKDLSIFVRDALSVGQARDEIAAALTDAGWAKAEIADALSDWADVDFPRPVPNPRSVVSARDFFVHGLTFALLLSAACYLNWLVFEVIDLIFGDHDNPHWIDRSIRNAIAGLIVTAPLYGWLTYREEKLQAENPGRSRSVIRNWLTYLTLLIAAGVFLGDAVWTLARFLNGEMTIITTLRMATVAVISGGIFLFYRRYTSGGAG